MPGDAIPKAARRMPSTRIALLPQLRHLLIDPAPPSHQNAQADTLRTRTRGPQNIRYSVSAFSRKRYST